MRAAFIGVTYHFRYTKSSQFFIDVLREAWGEVEVMSSEWRWVFLPRGPRFDVAIFWQHFPEPWELGILPADRIVLVPMQDDCPHDREFWKPYLGCRVLCFSRTLAELLEGWGHEVHRVQYFPPVPAQAVAWPDEAPRAFFWPRKPDLVWRHVEPLLAAASWKAIQYHRTENDAWADPGSAAERYPLEFSSWYPTKEAFAQDLVRNQVYFAPRRSEGIGLSFLEALGLGMAVVAVDSSTMNEYIVSGVSGHLYDPEHPVPPDWSQAPQWGAAARRSFVEGRARWLEGIPRLVNFLATGPVLVPARLHPWRTWRTRWLTVGGYGIFQFLNLLRWLRKRILNLIPRGHA